MLGTNLFLFFGPQSYGTTRPTGSAITLYRDFINDPQLNGPLSPYRIGPNINFVRNSAATYFDSNSAIVLAPVNIPRFEYTPTGEYLGLLIEQQSTNLVPYSESITSWTEPVSSIKVTLSGNITTVLTPDNAYTATLITATTANDFHTISWNGTPALLSETQPLSDAEYFTRSVFVKKHNARYIVCSVSPEPSATAGGGIPDFETFTNIFDLDTGQFTEFSILDTEATPLKNDWYRISFGRTSPNSNTNRFTIGLSNGPTFEDTRFAGDGNNLPGVFIWGVQAEKSFYPTSYIPTNGAATTRAADNASIFGTRFTQMYSPTATTFLTVASRNYTRDNNTFVTFINNIGTKYWTVNSDLSSTIHTLTVLSSAANLSSISVQNEVTNKTFYKLVATLSADDFALYQDNVLQSTLTGGFLPTIPNQIDRVQIGRIRNSDYLNGHIQILGHWPARLSNEQIINL
jgi:hypothetical protein